MLGRQPKIYHSHVVMTHPLNLEGKNLKQQSSVLRNSKCLSHLTCVSHHTEHFTYIDAFNLYNHLTRYYGAPYFTDEKTG